MFLCCYHYRQRDYDNSSNYHQELEEMRERVKQRPLLFERIGSGPTMELQ